MVYGPTYNAQLVYFYTFAHLLAQTSLMLKASPKIAYTLPLI